MPELKRANEMGADIAANPHYPAVAPTRPASPHPGPPAQRPVARKTMRSGARRISQAMVWSAPFRGPASPEKPFIILSVPLPKQLRFQSDGLLFMS